MRRSLVLFIVNIIVCLLVSNAKSRIDADVFDGTWQTDLPGLNPSIGNGFLGHVAGPKQHDLFAAGLFCERDKIFGLLPGVSRCRIALPECMTTSIDGFVSEKVELDVRNAQIVETLRAPNNQRIFFERIFYAHRSRPHVLVLELKMQSNEADDIMLNLTTEKVEPSSDLKLSSIDAANISTRTGSVAKPEKHAESVNISIVSSVPPTSIVLPQDTSLTLTFLTVVVTDISDVFPQSGPSSPDAVKKKAIAEFHSAQDSSASLRDEHVAAWDALWSRGGIEVDDEDLAAKINASFYYMLSSVREGVNYPVGPGGVQTNGYNGNAFWDNEMWAMPALLASWPELSSTGLLYRYARLSAAAEHAIEHKYDGLYFPWQSAGTGRECDLFEPANKLEIHVGGGIAHLARIISNVVGNKTFESTVVRPLVQGIATFYVSRAADESLTSIRNVVGPDEFAIGFPLYSGVSDSVYVNSAAKAASEYAVALGSSNAVARERWQTLAASLKILVENADTNSEFHPEYDGFPSKNRYYGGKVKQADVTMIHWPLNRPNLSVASLRNDLKTYEALYDPEGPAMTLSVSVVGWLRLGNVTRANALLKNSTANIQPPFHVWTESRDPHQHQTLKDEGCYNFLTGAGGFLQSIVQGYAGLSFLESDESLVIRPALGLPGDASELRLRSVSYRGARFSVRFSSKRTVQMCSLEVSGGAIAVVWEGEGGLDRGTSILQSPGICSTREGVVSLRVGVD